MHKPSRSVSFASFDKLESSDPANRRHGLVRNRAAVRTLAGMPVTNVRGWLTEVGVATARPAAFILYLIYAICWITLGNGLEWHSMATLATWGMTLLIQRAEHRDTQALHAKLDELLKVHGSANNSLMTIDDRDAEEVEHEREHVQNARR